jgi:hypothetical protein
MFHVEQFNGENKMSTRANYIFKNHCILGKDVYTYIHHDGYTSGAARYFYNFVMLCAERCNESFYEKISLELNVENFIRANDRVQLTTTLHGDIEYFYVLNGENLEAYDLCWSKDDKKTNKIFEGSIYEFINRYLSKEITNFYEFREIEDYKEVDKKTWVNKPILAKYINKEINLFSKRMLNSSSDEIKYMEKSTHKIKHYLSEYSKYFKDKNNWDDALYQIESFLKDVK